MNALKKLYQRGRVDENVLSLFVTMGGISVPIGSSGNGQREEKVVLKYEHLKLIYFESIWWRGVNGWTMRLLPFFV